ncbi:MAG: hypothetical protein M0P73_05355 [Syntrophobacterales bacterium]|jgi:Spy/CpxP family protein refolding chaperone|nr:hypothetical protein [Syntrophobacterales bacterium]
MRRRVILLFLGLILAGANCAWAQPGHEFGGGGFQDKLLEVKRSQLGPALGADQRTVDRLLEIDQRYKPLRRQLIMQMKSDMQRLQQLMGQSSPPESEIKAVLSDMKRHRLEMLNLQQRKDDEESSLLTPVQQARYLMYLMTLIREARSIKGGPSSPQGPAGMKPFTPGGPREIPVSRPPQ